MQMGMKGKRKGDASKRSKLVGVGVPSARSLPASSFLVFLVFLLVFLLVLLLGFNPIVDDFQLDSVYGGTSFKGRGNIEQEQDQDQGQEEEGLRVLDDHCGLSSVLEDEDKDEEKHNFGEGSRDASRIIKGRTSSKESSRRRRRRRSRRRSSKRRSLVPLSFLMHTPMLQAVAGQDQDDNSEGTSGGEEENRNSPPDRTDFGIPSERVSTAQGCFKQGRGRDCSWNPNVLQDDGFRFVCEPSQSFLDIDDFTCSSRDNSTCFFNEDYKCLWGSQGTGSDVASDESATRTCFYAPLWNLQEKMVALMNNEPQLTNWLSTIPSKCNSIQFNSTCRLQAPDCEWAPNLRWSVREERFTPDDDQGRLEIQAINVLGASKGKTTSPSIQKIDLLAPLHSSLPNNSTDGDIEAQLTTVTITTRAGRRNDAGDDALQVISSGTFRVVLFDGESEERNEGNVAQSSEPIEWNASAEEVQRALEQNKEFGDVSVTKIGNVENDPQHRTAWLVTFHDLFSSSSTSSYSVNQLGAQANLKDANGDQITWHPGSDSGSVGEPQGAEYDNAVLVSYHARNTQTLMLLSRTSSHVDAGTFKLRFYASGCPTSAEAAPGSRASNCHLQEKQKFDSAEISVNASAIEVESAIRKMFLANAEHYGTDGTAVPLPTTYVYAAVADVNLANELIQDSDSISGDLSAVRAWNITFTSFMATNEVPEYPLLPLWYGRGCESCEVMHGGNLGDVQLDTYISLTSPLVRGGFQLDFCSLTKRVDRLVLLDEGYDIGYANTLDAHTRLQQPLHISTGSYLFVAGELYQVVGMFNYTEGTTEEENVTPSPPSSFHAQLRAQNFSHVGPFIENPPVQVRPTASQMLQTGVPGWYFRLDHPFHGWTFSNDSGFQGENGFTALTCNWLVSDEIPYNATEEEFESALDLGHSTSIRSVSRRATTEHQSFNGEVLESWKVELESKQFGSVPLLRYHHEPFSFDFASQVGEDDVGDQQSGNGGSPSSSTTGDDPNTPHPTIQPTYSAPELEPVLLPRPSINTGQTGASINVSRLQAGNASLDGVFRLAFAGYGGSTSAYERLLDYTPSSKEASWVSGSGNSQLWLSAPISVTASAEEVKAAILNLDNTVTDSLDVERESYILEYGDGEEMQIYRWTVTFLGDSLEYLSLSNPGSLTADIPQLYSPVFNNSELKGSHSQVVTETLVNGRGSLYKPAAEQLLERAESTNLSPCNVNATMRDDMIEEIVGDAILELEKLDETMLKCALAPVPDDVTPLPADAPTMPPDVAPDTPFEERIRPFRTRDECMELSASNEASNNNISHCVWRGDNSPNYEFYVEELQYLLSADALHDFWWVSNFYNGNSSTTRAANCTVSMLFKSSQLLKLYSRIAPGNVSSASAVAFDEVSLALSRYSNCAQNPVLEIQAIGPIFVDVFQWIITLTCYTYGLMYGIAGAVLMYRMQYFNSTLKRAFWGVVNTFGCMLFGGIIGFIVGALPAALISQTYASIPVRLGSDMAITLGVAQALLFLYFDSGRGASRIR